MSKINVDARLIGIIGKPHGIKGEVIMKLLTDYPKTIKKGNILFLSDECKKKVEVESIREKNGRGHPELIIKFNGIDDRNSAENLRGSEIYRRAQDSPKLKKDEYWVDDIIGCRVYNKDNVFIGKVMGIEKLPSNDNLLLKKEGNGKKIKQAKGNILYIPIIKRYIDRINIKEKKVILKEIPEYI